MKETIDLIKKLWANKRYRALAILLIYVIFFTFVFMFISSLNKQAYVEETNYNDYQIIIGDDAIVYDSTDETVLYDNNVYNINDLPDQLKEYNLMKFRPTEVFGFINEATLESTNYIDKTNTYIIDGSKIDSSLDGVVKITTYGDDKSEILINLKEYYGYDIRIKLRS